MASIIFRIPARYGKRRGPMPGRTPYQKRDEVLFRLGFASYGDYLKSPLWKVIREAKLAVDERCECCGDKAQQVHHLEYKRTVLTGKERHKLVSVCEPCHVKIEFTSEGQKRSFEGTLKKAKRMLVAAGRWEEHKRH